MITDDDKKGPSFDLLKIWINEDLENDLESYLTNLLKLINDLIKKYSDSDDFGEYSKKEELWKRISNSNEVSSFVSSNDSELIIQKYGISKADLIKRKGADKTNSEINFKNLSDNVLIHSNGINYYEKIKSNEKSLSNSDFKSISNIIHSIINKIDIDDKLILIESKITNNLRINNPSFFDNIEIKDNYLFKAFDQILLTYNKCINEKSDVLSEFKKIETIAGVKKIKYSSVFSEMGKLLRSGSSPKIKQLYYSSYYFRNSISESNNSKSKPDYNSLKINESLMRKMFEWDSNAKTLSLKERTYIADFAWGLKKINSFHENNIRRHLKTLVSKGFSVY